MNTSDSSRLARGAAATLMLAGALGSAGPAGGAELKDVQVTVKDGRYYVVAEMTVDAPLEATFNALVEYDRFDEHSDIYVKTRYLDPATDGTPRVFTRIEGCVLGFCRGVERIMLLEATPFDVVRATVESESDGNLRYGRETWALSPTEEGTLIIYHHELELGFWLPPLIGPWAVRRALHWGASDVVQTLEDIALTGSYTPLAESPCCQAGKGG